MFVLGKLCKPNLTKTLAYYEIHKLRTKFFITLGPRVCCTKLFTTVTIFYRCKLECLLLSTTSSIVKYLWQGWEPTLRVEYHKGAKLVLKWQRVTNTLAYCSTEWISAWKSFFLYRQQGQYWKILCHCWCRIIS